MNTNKTIGQRIKEQRKNMNMTQEELAEYMCIPKSTISAYENDKVDIKSSVIIELATILHTSPDYLLGFSEYDPITTEIIELLKGINDEKAKTMLLAQISGIKAMFSK